MMKDRLSDFVTRFNNPFFQGSCSLALCMMLMLCVQFLKWTHIMEIELPTFWVMAGTIILFFALFNSVVSLSATDMNKYWFHSTIAYACLMLLSSGIAYLFSGLTITEAGTFPWIFFILTFGYLLFLSMMRFLRKIVFIAQQEDDKWMNRVNKNKKTNK